MKPILIIPIILFFSCLTTLAQNDSKALTFDDFKSNLKKDMDNKTIVKTFGQPDKDIGSGIYIFIYKLSDSTTMIIGCTNKILYAYHFDKQGEKLHVLVGNPNLKCNPRILEHSYLAVLRPDLYKKSATVNDQIIFTAQAGQLILYNATAGTAWIEDGRFGDIPSEDLVKVDTFYFRFNFSNKNFVLDSENELLVAPKKRGFDINKIANDVIKKDHLALNNLFTLRNTFDGTPSELFPKYFWSILMTWNDKCIADFITNLKRRERKQFVNYIIDNNVTFPIEKPLIYYELYYPETFELINKYK